MKKKQIKWLKAADAVASEAKQNMTSILVAVIDAGYSDAVAVVTARARTGRGKLSDARWRRKHWSNPKYAFSRPPISNEMAERKEDKKAGGVLFPDARDRTWTGPEADAPAEAPAEKPAEKKAKRGRPKKVKTEAPVEAPAEEKKAKRGRPKKAKVEAPAESPAAKPAEAQAEKPRHTTYEDLEF